MKKPKTQINRIKKIWEKVDTIKRGRREIPVYKTARGKLICVHSRRFREIYMQDARTIFEAIESGDATWMIDMTLWSALSRRNVEYFGVYCKENDGFWLTGFSNFGNNNITLKKQGKFQSRDILIHLPFRYWTFKQGENIPL